jgi:hypothetical protein
MTPEGAAVPTPKPRSDETLVKALVRAHRWRRRIESGRARSITDLAEQEGVTDAYVCRLLPLTCVAPDIVEAILDGRQPKGLRLAELLGNGPLAWKTPEGDLGLHQLTKLLKGCVRPRSSAVALSPRPVPAAEPSYLTAHVVPSPEFKGGVDEVGVNAFDAEGGRRNWLGEHWSVRRRRLVGHSDEDPAHSPSRLGDSSQSGPFRRTPQQAARRTRVRGGRSRLGFSVWLLRRGQQQVRRDHSVARLRPSGECVLGRVADAQIGVLGGPLDVPPRPVAADPLQRPDRGEAHLGICIQVLWSTDS